MQVGQLKHESSWLREAVQIWVTWALVLGYVVAFWYAAAWATGALWNGIFGG